MSGTRRTRRARRPAARDVGGSRRGWRVATLTVLALSLAACAGGGPASDTRSEGRKPMATESTPTSEPTNPVWPNNFPDPQVLTDGPRYVAIATNGNGMNVQTLTSDNLFEWSQGSDALPKLASWSTPGKVWAPEAVKLGLKWVMYYTTRAPNPEIQCIGVAVGDAPVGPYRDSTRAPLVCEADQGGSIDASPFVDQDGAAYLYWKNDGNAVGMDTWISVQPLAPDGLSLTGRPQRLLKQDLAWEGGLIEAPQVWRDGGIYHLFYSANDYGSAQYSVGHATATSPTGPFTKDPEPVLATTDVAAGPGHCALFEKDGRVWMAYHAWSPDAIGSEVPGRAMWLSEVHLDGIRARVDPPATQLGLH